MKYANSKQHHPTHGGSRKGAGRPYSGRKAYTITILPKHMARWKKAAKSLQIGVGELMEKIDPENLP